jgi:hypothetical protein
LIFEFLNMITEPVFALFLMQNIAWIIVVVIEICLLSLCYDWLVSN